MPTLLERTIIALRQLLQEACEYNLNIYVICSCINSPIGGMDVHIHVPHLRLNQTNERICLAWSGNHGLATLQILQEEITRFVQGINQNFIPSIYYACPLHVSAQNNLGIHIPGIAQPAQVGNQIQPVNQQVPNQPAED